MDRTRLRLASVALVGLWATAPAWGQNPSPVFRGPPQASQELTPVSQGPSQVSQGQSTPRYQYQQPHRSLSDHLGEFGRALFGSRNTRQPTRSTRGLGVANVGPDALIDISPRSAAKHARQPAAAFQAEDDSAAAETEELDVGEPPPDTKVAVSPEAERAPAKSSAGPTFPKASTLKASTPRASTASSGDGFGSLHERLRTFRESAFGHTPPDGPAAAKPTAAKAPKSADLPAAAAQNSTERPHLASPARRYGSEETARPSGTPRGTLRNPASMYSKSPEANQKSAETGSLQRSLAERFTAERSARQPAAVTGTATSQAPTSAGAAAKSPATASKQPAKAAEKTTRETADPAESTDPGVLFLRQSPILSVETHGPRRITVGKQSAYEVIIHNSGQVAANELVLTVELPEWADVLGAEASTGATQSLPAADRSGRFLWKVGRLDAKAQEKLVLRIVPRQSRPFELGVKWSFTPVRSQAEIEVQEPKLVLELDGPHEVLHGHKEVYKLTLTNTGNGPAENLLVKLTPIGPGQNVSAAHKLGSLAAGQKKVIEVELTARHAGQLIIQVSVDGDGGVHAERSEKVLVRRAVLSLDVDGPKTRYVGTAASYRIRLVNTGTAPARNVTLDATIPPGAEQVSAGEGASLSPDRKTIHWGLAELAPEAERILVVKCDLGQAGAGQFAVAASADDDLNASSAVTTQVEAIADLELSVADPVGPVPVGQQATYQVRIQNRGTKSAENIEAVGYFSTGIEPTSADGATHKITPGQVVFGPIPSIAAGQTLVLTIQAKAQTPGNHVFRTEVYCRSLDSRLVSEETTRFYGSGPASAAPQVAQPTPTKAPPASPQGQIVEPSPTKAPAVDPAPRTAERRRRIEPIRSSQRPLSEGEKNR